MRCFFGGLALVDISEQKYTGLYEVEELFDDVRCFSQTCTDFHWYIFMVKRPCDVFGGLALT